MVADERLRQARNILVTPSFQRNDSVQTNDRVDLRSFRLIGRSNVQINLSGIKRGANVDIQLFSLKNPTRALRQIGNRSFVSLSRRQRNQFITTLGTSRRGGNANESITQTLDSGQYYLSVQYRSGRGRVNYRLAGEAAAVGGGNGGGDNGGGGDGGGNSGDRGGNTATSATPIEIDFTDRVIEDTVGGSDTNDYYRFTIPSDEIFSRGAIFNLNLTELTADLNVEVRDANNAVIGLSANDGNASEAITIGASAEPLSPGEYLIRVFPASSGQSGSYRLTYSAIPLDRAPNTPEEALDITSDLDGTSIDEPFEFPEFVGGADTFDYYKFTVPAGGSFTSVTVEPRQGSVNVTLFRADPNNPNQLLPDNPADPTDDPIQAIAQPPRLEGEGENQTKISDGFGGNLDDLPPGTYFLRIDSNPATQGVLYDLVMYTQPRNNNPTIARDINPGRRPSSPRQITVVGNSLFFVATDGTGRALWRADGRNAAQLGTLGSIKKVALPANVTFNPDAAINANLVAGQFTNAQGAAEPALYFVAGTGNGQTALWRTNGQGATEQILTLSGQPGTPSIEISEAPVNVNGTLYFVATVRETLIENGIPVSRTRFALYRSNGTASGTAEVQGTANFTQIQRLTAIGNTLYFSGSNGVTGANATGEEVWRITGPNAAPQVIDVVPGGTSSSPRNFFGVSTPNGSDVYFVATGSDRISRLWRLSPGAAQAVRVPNGAVGTPRLLENPNIDPFVNSPNFTLFNNQIYFSAFGSSPNSTQGGGAIGQELWRINNNGAIELVADLRPNNTSAFSSTPRQLTVVGSGPSALLYFTADNGTSGVELWRYNGTEPPVQIEISNIPLEDVDGNPTSNTRGSIPQNLTADQAGNLYFTATAPSPENATIGTELWRLGTDGTLTSFDILPGSVGSQPTQLTSLLGRLFFSANNGAGAPGTPSPGNGEELWVIG